MTSTTWRSTRSRCDGTCCTGPKATGRGSEAVRAAAGSGAVPAAELAGLGKVLGDLAELDVQPLRRAAEQVEGVVGGDPEPLHQDALGLADDVAGGQGRVQLTAELLQRPALPDGPEGDRGVGGQDQADLAGPVVEGVGLAGVGVQ